ncbi:MAG: site-specific DNA-methyltransferase, partial [Actinobacteria bacterium]|nr:site-specific DNA-methyltransferase [Actinomycetota bacterium]
MRDASGREDGLTPGDGRAARPVAQARSSRHRRLAASQGEGAERPSPQPTATGHRRPAAFQGEGVDPWADGVNYVYGGDNLPLLRGFRSESVQLIYVDPPFNTGRAQARTQIRTVRDAAGDRTGFQGRRYRTVELARRSFDDAFDDYLGFLEPRLVEARRLLTGSGTLYVHLDFREVHYVKLMLDGIFGRACFLNEIIWAYDYGGRTTKRWPPKHDNILVYVKDPAQYYFSVEEMERIPYMAPGLVGPEKAARGKLPTDTWWHTI